MAKSSVEVSHADLRGSVLSASRGESLHNSALHLSAPIHFILQRLESEHNARTEEARAAAAAAANLQAHAEQQLEAGKATIAQVRE